MNSAIVEILHHCYIQARMADCMYAGPVEMGELVEYHGSQLNYVTVGSILAMVMDMPSYCYVGICGSRSATDWRTNFDAGQTQLSNSLFAHRGFSESAERLRRAFASTCLIPADRPVIFGGHSSGGAIAEVLAWKLHVMGKANVDRVVTFGAPRVWTPESAVSYRQLPWSLHRITMPGDVVPLLPRRKHRFLFGRNSYTHASLAIELGDEGRFRLQESRHWLHSVLSLMHSAVAGSVSAIGVSNVFATFSSIRRKHSIERYVGAISEALRGI